jgi:hypothetical protein
MKERLAGGEAFAVEQHDRSRRASPVGVAKVEDLDPTSSCAVAEYFSVLDDAPSAARRRASRSRSRRSIGGPLCCGGQHRCRLRLFRQLPRWPKAHPLDRGPKGKTPRVDPFALGCICPWQAVLRLRGGIRRL